jgi:hypothetical protein
MIMRTVVCGGIARRLGVSIAAGRCNPSDDKGKKELHFVGLIRKA